MAAPTTYAALLRAINVGGTGKLPMKDLCALCTGAGFKDVRTYIQSGNVVFRSALSPSRVAATFEKALAAHMGKHFDVVLRTAGGIREVLDANPFPGEPPSRVLVFLSNERLPSGVLEGAVAPGGEQAIVRGQELYVLYPDGMGQSKLKLPGMRKVVATARNMNTIRKLVEMTSVAG